MRGRFFANAMFLGGLMVLLMALYLKFTLPGFRLDSVVIKPDLSNLTAPVRCTLEGVNPLPFSLRMEEYELALGKKTLPIALALSSKSPFSIPAGNFLVEVQLIGEGGGLAVILGQGFSLLRRKQLDYSGEVLLSRAGLERRVHFEGWLNWAP